MKKHLLLSLFFWFIGTCIYAQDLSKILVDKLYITTLDKVMDDIGAINHLKFEFDREILVQFEVNERPIQKPLNLFLDQQCGEHKLKWYQSPDRVIHIDNKYQQLTSKPQETQKKKTYTGPALKFQINLTGVVKDKQTGEALPFANVGVRGTVLGTFTNADGYFSLINIPSDTSTLMISYIGYKNAIIFLTPDLPLNNLLIEMESQSQTLKEIVVTGEQEQLMHANDKISSLKITPQKLATLPNIGEKDVIRSFQLLPGVSAANESSSNLYVRGGTPDQNLLLYDGFTIYQVDHLYGFFSAFNSNAIKDVQLYKGGFESKFGGRLSSVTEITGKDGNSKGFTIGGEVSLLSFNLYLEVPVGKRFTSLIAFRRSYQGLLYDKIFKQFNYSSEAKQVSFKGGGKEPPGGGASLNTTIQSYFYDINAKFTYRPSPKDIISLSFYNGTDKLDNGSSMGSSGGGGGFSFNMENSDLTRYGNLGGGLRWSRNWNTRIYSNTLISLSNYYSMRDRTSSGTHSGGEGGPGRFNSGISENNNLFDLTFKSDYAYSLNNKHQLSFGVFLTDYIISYKFGETDTSIVLNKNENGILAGGYFQDKIKIFDTKLAITPGVRISFFSPTGKVYFEPRVSLVYNLTKKFKLIAETGKFYQFANRVVHEDILTGSRDFWILSDGDTIPVSSAWHYIAGISYENKDFLASIEGYYKNIDGVTEYSLRFNPTREGTTYAENFYNGIGYATGLEFLLQKKIGNLTGWVCYTLSQAKNKIAIYGDNYFPASQDVTHEFKFVSMYDYKNWSFSLTWLFASGRPYTAPDGAYSVSLLNGTEQTFIDFGSKNSSRLPPYHRLDIGVNYHFKKQDTGNEWGNIGVSIFNVYNRRNIWYREYQIIDGNIIETDKLFLGFTPNITLSLKLR
ncbi:MAG: TonB-dependent receptor [Bacteroidales bacterium]|nr:TonB-dependent receptor [Bacteroidales bacterium]